MLWRRLPDTTANDKFLMLFIMPRAVAFTVATAALLRLLLPVLVLFVGWVGVVVVDDAVAAV